MSRSSGGGDEARLMARWIAVGVKLRKRSPKQLERMLALLAADALEEADAGAPAIDDLYQNC